MVSQCSERHRMSGDNFSVRSSSSSILLRMDRMLRKEIFRLELVVAWFGLGVAYEVEGL